MPRNYWLNLFTIETWEEFLASGASVSGSRENRWTFVQRMRPGDYLLCYLTGVSRFIGVLEVTGEAYKASEPRIWSAEEFPCRVDVRVTAQLTPETAVPVHDLLSELSFYDPARPNAWSASFQGSPRTFPTGDGEIVSVAIEEALAHPVDRPIPARKQRPRKLKTSTNLGAVSIPDDDPSDQSTIQGPQEDVESEAQQKEATAHTEIQWLLLKLGNDMGLDVWVARNDRSREYRGNRFAALPRFRADLPRQFDEATHSTIELIDVLWLRDTTIVARSKSRARRRFIPGCCACLT